LEAKVRNFADTAFRFFTIFFKKIAIKMGSVFAEKRIFATRKINSNQLILKTIQNQIH
jgi:hypothetical protein